MYKKKLSLFVVFLVVSIMLGACSVEGPYLANGQNYFCPDLSYIDIIQHDPLQVRFTCSDKEQGFEIVFEGPNDSELIDLLRDNTEGYWMGVILKDGEIIQFYEGYRGRKIVTHWPKNND